MACLSESRPMTKRCHPALAGLPAIVALAAGLAAGPVRAQGEPLPAGAVTVAVDNAKIVRLPQGTQTVIVGNPGIADVTMQKNGVLVLTGKSYGTTNLIALDAGGGMLAESFVNVRAPEAQAMVTVQRGLERESYSCTPSCQPTAQLGDAARYFTEVSGQAGARNKFAQPGATGGAGAAPAAVP
jgi:Flp pilus assembly secretin CpaC